MAIQTPLRPASTPGEDGVDAGVIDDARRRQRRHRLVGAATLAAAGVAGALMLGSGGGGHGAAVPSGDRSSAAHRIRAGALTVSLPDGWDRAVERGNYRACTNPIVRLDLASYRLPGGFGTHEGPTVVPRDGILLELVSGPIRSTARPWRQWRLSDHHLMPARNVGPNHYAAEVNLPGSAAVGATVWLGSVPAPGPILAAADRILRSVRVDQTYGCQ